MSEDVQGTVGETKKITAGLVISWIYSVVVGLASIADIASGMVLAGFVLLLSALVVFPPFTAWIEKRFKFALSRMLKVIIVIVLLVIVGVIASKNSPSIKASDAQTAPNTASAQKPGTSAAPAKTPIQVSAAALYKAFNQNQVSADAKYKGNVVEVTGNVVRVGKDVMSNAYVELRSSQYADFGIQCTFPQSGESALASISSGQNVTLEGTVSTYDGMDVLVDGCSIVKN